MFGVLEHMHQEPFRLAKADSYRPNACQVRKILLPFRI